MDKPTDAIDPSQGPLNIPTEAPTDPSAAAPSVPTPDVSAPVAAATQAAADAFYAAKDKAFDTMSNPNVRIIFTVLIGLSVSAIAGAVLYWFVSRYITQRRVWRFPETEAPLLGTQVAILPADRVPSSKNGKRQTMMFWIYIHDINKYNGIYRHVLHRGDRNDKWDKASPAVFIDNDTNKLHITIGTEDADPYDGNDLQTDEDKYKYILATRGITIDYIPLQRWVHVAIVVNEDVNSGSITAYMDGELTHVVTKEKKTTVRTRRGIVTKQLTIHNANLDKKGNVYVGGSPSDEVGPGFSGLISRLAIFNYDLNIKDVYEEYKKGPVSSVSAKLGYGVRSPVYRVR